MKYVQAVGIKEHILLISSIEASGYAVINPAGTA